MSTVRMLALAAVGACLMANAQAQQNLYGGVTLSMINYEEEGLPSVSPTTVGIKFGSKFHPNLAAEVRLGIGASSDSLTIQGIPIDIEVDNYVGAYLKGLVPLSPVVSVYGLIGYTRGELTASAFGNSISESESDVSFGLGIEVDVASNVSLAVEWARLFDGPEYTVNAITGALNFKF